MSDFKKNKNSTQTELENVQKQFDAFEQDIKDQTLDRMNEAKPQEVERQTKLSSQDLRKSNEIYLKPVKTVARRDKFNEKFRSQYNYSKELVCFIAENREVVGEDIELWTAPFGGVPCEYWKVPVNKPVWGPRYLAERIKDCKYHRFVMRENIVTESGGYGQMYGSMAVDTTIQRLDAIPAGKRSSIFMGASGF